MKEKAHIRTIVAKNIKRYRKMNNLTQEALAEASGVSNTYIANIECGQTWISDKTLEKIAFALHLDAYLFFIPEELESESADIKKQQEIISYLQERKSTLTNHIKDFFTETFDYILEKK